MICITSNPPDLRTPHPWSGTMATMPILRSEAKRWNLARLSAFFVNFGNTLRNEAPPFGMRERCCWWLNVPVHYLLRTENYSMSSVKRKGSTLKVSYVASVTIQCVGSSAPKVRISPTSSLGATKANALGWKARGGGAAGKRRAGSTIAAPARVVSAAINDRRSIILLYQTRGRVCSSWSHCRRRSSSSHQRSGRESPDPTRTS